MRHTLKYHAERAGVALAVATVLSVVGIGTAQAQTFTSVDFDIATKTSEAKEVGAGDLVCSWRESGLTPYAAISYDCTAEAVAATFACVYKNRMISDTVNVTAYDVNSNEHGGGGGGGVGVVSTGAGVTVGCSGCGGGGLPPQFRPINTGAISTRTSKIPNLLML